MPYAIFSDNNFDHFSTQQKPIAPFDGHLDTKDPLNVDMNEKLINNFE